MCYSVFGKNLHSLDRSGTNTDAKHSGLHGMFHFANAVRKTQLVPRRQDPLPVSCGWRSSSFIHCLQIILLLFAGVKINYFRLNSLGFFIFFGSYLKAKVSIENALR